MTESRIYLYIQAVADTLRERLPQSVTVHMHGGVFDLPELRKYAVKLPAIVVSPIEGGSVKRAGPTARAELVMGLYAIGRHAPTPVGTGDEQCIRICETVLQFLPTVTFGATPYGTAPADIRMENLYAGDLDKLGVRLWGITWKTAIDLDVPDSCTALDDFLRLHADYDIGQLDPSDFTAPQQIEVPGPQE